MEAGRKIRVQPRVIAEVAKAQMGQMHAEKIGARTARPRVFSARHVAQSKIKNAVRHEIFVETKPSPKI
jgi:hypothetical protein